MGQTVAISPNRTDFLGIPLFWNSYPVWVIPSNYFLKAETRPPRDEGTGVRF